MAALFVQPLQQLPSQLRASGTRGSAVRAWLPQKSIARKTGAGPVRSFGTTSIKSICGALAGPISSVTSLSVAFPPRKSWYSPSTLTCSMGRLGRNGAVHVVLKQRLQFGPAFLEPLVPGSDAPAIEHHQRVGQSGRDGSAEGSGNDAGVEGAAPAAGKTPQSPTAKVNSGSSSASSYQACRFRESAHEVHALHGLAAGAFDQVVLGAHDDQPPGARVERQAISITLVPTTFLVSGRALPSSSRTKGSLA